MVAEIERLQEQLKAKSDLALINQGLWDKIEMLQQDKAALAFQLDHTITNLDRNEKSNAELLAALKLALGIIEYEVGVGSDVDHLRAIIEKAEAND